MASCWTLKEAAAELERLLNTADLASLDGIHGSAFTQWRSELDSVMTEVFGLKSKHTRSLAQVPWGQVGTTLISAIEIIHHGSPQLALEAAREAEFDRHLSYAKGLLAAAITDLKRKGITKIYDGKNTGPEASDLLKLLRLLERKVRNSFKTHPADEIAVQDVVRTLLDGAQLSYTREQDRIVYSSKTYIPDFVLSELDLALEIKLCPERSRIRTIIAEINDDIKAHATRFGNQIFVVYDLGQIQDVEKFVADFEKSDGVRVIVVKH